MRRPAFATSGQVWAAAGTTIATGIATVALIIGIFQWQLIDFREEMRAETGSIREEIFAIRGEVAALGERIGALGKRVARVETLLADRLPTAP